MKNRDSGVIGEVEANMSGDLYKVRLPDGKEVLARPNGKMRVHHIRVLIGDRVRLQLDPYGGHDTNRIVERLRTGV